MGRMTREPAAGIGTRRASRSSWRRGLLVWPAAAALLVAGGCATVRQTPPGPLPEVAGQALRELAERVEKAAAGAGDSPGREYANLLRGPPYAAWLSWFKGRGHRPSYPELKSVVEELTDLAGRLESVAEWPPPGSFDVPRAAVPPVIDGVLDDAVWEGALTWRGAYPFNGTEPSGPATTWKMLWDENCLYFAFDCEDDDLVAPVRKRDEPVFFDDSVEMFLLPEPRHRVYWEIVVAPGDLVYDSLNCKLLESWGADIDPRQDVAGLRCASTFRGTLNHPGDEDRGYVIEAAVPFASLPEFTRCPPRPGDQLRLMLVRLDRSRGVFSAHAFRPLLAWGHNIWNHATVTLSGEEAATAPAGR